MRHAITDDFFWAAGLCGQVALTGVLIRKRRWRKFPAFAALIALPIFASLVLLPLDRLAGATWYARGYLVFAVLDFLIQLCIVVELARIVLRPTGTWVRDARKQFLLSASAGTVLALLVACTVAPPAPNRTEFLEFRANLFTSLLICELVVAISVAANRLGLGWKNHVMAIGQGLMVWSTIATIVDSLHSFFGTSQLYEAAEYVKSLAYLGALWYWGVQLWQEEPEPKPISPQLRKFIVALHERVQYDLGEAGR